MKAIVSLLVIVAWLMVMFAMFDSAERSVGIDK